MKKIMMVLVAMAMVAFSGVVKAEDVIDFESMGENEIITSIQTDTNTVSFESNEPGSDLAIAQIGAPATAFAINDNIAEDVGGEMFLTMPDLSGSSYVFKFETPVLRIGFHLYDYRDGTARPGDTAILTAYSDMEMTEIVGEDSVAIQISPVDGTVEWLQIIDPTGPIVVVRLVFSGYDPGTGIDNITFETIPDFLLEGMVQTTSAVESSVQDVEVNLIDSKVRNVRINQNLKNGRGNITLTLDYSTLYADQVLGLISGEEVEFKLSVTQDENMTEFTGAKKVRKVGKSPHKMNYR